MNIVAHIIGLDEIHKKIFSKQLPKHIKIIDLDEHQQSIYNSNQIIKLKMIWNQLSKDTVQYQKQRKLIGSKRIKTRNINNQIKNLISKRNIIKQNIHKLWKIKMIERINQQLRTNDKYNIVFVGFNIFPKDYRVKVNISLTTINFCIGKQKYFNRIVINTKPNIYAANQIKYYLKTYHDKIVKGTFPLNLLKIDYLACKYQKFIAFYAKQQYQFLKLGELLNMIINLDKQLSDKNKLSDKIYVATLFKAGDTIPVNTLKPIIGFNNRIAAITHIKSKMKKNMPIYLYEINSNQFELINGQLIATKTLYPINEESFLLTI